MIIKTPVRAVIVPRRDRRLGWGEFSPTKPARPTNDKQTGGEGRGIIYCNPFSLFP